MSEKIKGKINAMDKINLRNKMMERKNRGDLVNTLGRKVRCHQMAKVKGIRRTDFV